MGVASWSIKFDRLTGLTGQNLLFSGHVLHQNIEPLCFLGEGLHDPRVFHNRYADMEKFLRGKSGDLYQPVIPVREPGNHERAS